MEPCVLHRRPVHRRRLRRQPFAVARRRPHRRQTPQGVDVVGVVTQTLLQQLGRVGQRVRVRRGGVGVLLFRFVAAGFAAESGLHRQAGAEEGDRRPLPALRQAQRPVDGLGTGRGVAALLLDDRLADQRPVIDRVKAMPAGQQRGRPVHVAACGSADRPAGRAPPGSPAPAATAPPRTPAPSSFRPASSSAWDRASRNASPFGG